MNALPTRQIDDAIVSPRRNDGGMQDYHQLHVWERAHAFAIAVRRTADQFPPGYSELRSQIIRAAESIPSNLVEGCGAATRREFARFVDISIKSSAEVQYRLELARDHSLLAPERWEELTAEVIEIRKMLHGFRKKLLAANALSPRRKPGAER